MNKLFLVLWCVIGLTACAHADWWHAEPAPSKSPVLNIVELRDAGGLPAQDEPKLNVKLTSAFRKIMAGEAKDTVVIPDKLQKPRRGATAWTLEGEVSGFDNGHGITSYCCVMRLYREGRRRELVTEWSGIADSLRYLTGNLMQHPAVHDYGLVGDIGQRALNVMKADEKQADFMKSLDDLTHVLPAARETTVQLSPVLDEAPTNTQLPGLAHTRAPRIAAGKPFTVEVTTAQPVSVIYAIRDESDIRLVRAQTALKDSGQYARLQYTAPATHDEKTLRLVFLLHLKKLMMAESPTPLVTPTTTESAPPVRIVETCNRETQTNTTLPEALLALTRSDPYGSWLVKTVEYQLQPGR